MVGRLILGGREGREMVGGALGSPEAVGGAEGSMLACPAGREEGEGEKDGGTPLAAVGMEWWALIGVFCVPGKEGGRWDREGCMLDCIGAATNLGAGPLGLATPTDGWNNCPGTLCCCTFCPATAGDTPEKCVLVIRYGVSPTPGNTLTPPTPGRTLPPPPTAAPLAVVTMAARDWSTGTAELCTALPGCVTIL